MKYYNLTNTIKFGCSDELEEKYKEHGVVDITPEYLLHLGEVIHGDKVGDYPPNNDALYAFLSSVAQDTLNTSLEDAMNNNIRINGMIEEGLYLIPSKTA